MQNISSSEELRYAIELLEADQVIKGQVFKEQLFLAYESLKPINLIKYPKGYHFFRLSY